MGAGYLLPIPPFNVDYLPVTCSHTVAALNMLRAEKNTVRGLFEELSTDGYVDRDKVLKFCPSWQKPLQDGIP